ncbi:putative indole-3-pyruvate monooxygenase [Nymphaea thermarum]|nr:putative indole-3-pyruvate monooxygenase [Nymphaea thermarum]
MKGEQAVVIVGAGPAGLAVSACLTRLSISNLILERETCSVSLWRNRAYDRLCLHLGKTFCQLPHMPYPEPTPTFPSKAQFISYVDDYMARFGLQPKYGRWVRRAAYDATAGTWRLEVSNNQSGEAEEYAARFLVVATGENGEGFVPEIVGLDGFPGEVLHSSEYKSGGAYWGREVLVVGCGNSGMEIAFDLCEHGARASVVVRNPVHVLTKEIVYMGMQLLNCLPVSSVDPLAIVLGKNMFGNLEKYGITEPQEGPFFLKAATGRSPVLDVGTIDKIKSGEIKVRRGIKHIRGNNVEFEDGKVHRFDAIVFATGYRSTVRTWLQEGDGLFNKDGFPEAGYPDHWKGKNGLYCAGFSKRGLFGISEDARKIADDISNHLLNKHN